MRNGNYLVMKGVSMMDYHLLNDYRDKSRVEHNIIKIKLVSNVTTATLLIFLVIELLFKLTKKVDLIQLNWLPYTLIISVNVLWHIICKKYEQEKTPSTIKKLEQVTNFYIYAMLISGAIITISNNLIFNDLMMYTLIMLICSSYFVLKKQQIVRPMIAASLLIFLGFYLTIGYNDEFVTKVAYIAILNPIAYVVSRSFYNSFNKSIRTRLKLLREMEERKKVMRQLRDANRQLKLQSSLDPLTQISNRRAVNEYMKQLSDQTTKGSFMLSTIMLDVDYFKQYNDTYGHLAGDEVLIKVGDILQQLSEQYNVFVARWGGEEFMIVLMNTDERKLQMICETILRRVEFLNVEHKTSLVSDRLTVSIGAHSVTVQKPSDVFESLDYADMALYDVKKSGRNGFAIRISIG